MFTRILVPVDGSDHALHALRTAKTMADQFKEPASILVLHVNPELSFNEPPLGVDVDARLEEEGRHIMEPVQELLKEIPENRRKSLMKHGDPAKLICETAAAEQADLIVMGTRGMSLVSEMLLGSVSHAVIQHAACPVVTVK
ncbi:universal stress protein [Paenibacillus sp. CAA11]|uniref:universal stress protein n=1 Tax=Paenibacillus sp. CAA11 TaxID=1532905 RepID=UPI000D38BD00|nr:universal stress protein [Paenibacillus sp. CAA11]AWB43306.1 universal stress protein [Paenibacillus sp. CAA11]